jgi:hypothetical protein
MATCCQSVSSAAPDEGLGSGRLTDAARPVLGDVVVRAVPRVREGPA